MLIPVYQIIASQYPVAASTVIEQGMPVALDSNGYAVQAQGGGSGNTNVVVGISADRNRASEALEFVNRLSDSGNDTAASGMLTVYHTGGEFFIDVNDSAITTPAGTAIQGVLESNATKTPGTLLYASTNAGHLTHTQTGTERAVAVIVENSGAIDSGIPGEYEPGSSVAYASDGTSRTWVKIKLLV